MILEVATLDVIEGQEDEFLRAFDRAQHIIMVARGYLGHELGRSISHRNRFLLLVRWRRLEDHTVGFRSSPGYQRWSQLLHRYYEPAPDVAHYEIVA